MQKDRREVERGLLAKGFIPIDGDHRFFQYVTLDGVTIGVRTKTSHGSEKYKSLGDALLGSMAKQCSLSKKDFIDFVECNLSREAYEGKLREQGRL
jgi:hypothetical protein